MGIEPTSFGQTIRYTAVVFRYHKSLFCLCFFLNTSKTIKKVVKNSVVFSKHIWFGHRQYWLLIRQLCKKTFSAKQVMRKKRGEQMQGTVVPRHKIRRDLNPLHLNYQFNVLPNELRSNVHLSVSPFSCISCRLFRFSAADFMGRKLILCGRRFSKTLLGHGRGGLHCS